MVRLAEKRLRRGPLHHPSRVHHRNLVAELRHHRNVMRDQQHRQIQLILQVLQDLQDLMLHDHIQRRDGLIGDQQTGVQRQGHRDDRPLLHAAAEFVRIMRKTLRVQAHQLKQHDRSFARLRLRKPPADFEQLFQLMADAPHRVQRIHAGLGDGGDFTPANLAHFRRRQLQQVTPLEIHLTAGDAPVAW